MTKQLTEKFREALRQYTSRQKSLEDVDPEIVKANLTRQVRSFFARVNTELADLKSDVKSRLKESKALQQYDVLVHQNKDLFQANPQFELQKQIFDEKIRRGRYVYVIKRCDFYKDLIN